MLSIFYDLETTDKNPIGQILNFSFIVVDKQFSIVDELSESIKISRLQLPTPEALLKNRTDVGLHQKEALLSEPQAMSKIHDFISKTISKNKQAVHFIGYNSSKFDLPFLRTSLVRNGFEPYFSRGLIYRDLYSAVKFLAVVSDAFPRPQSKQDPERVSLSLENVCQAFSILGGVQTHLSRDDVLLSIELAKVLREKFDLDIREFDPYQGLAAEKSDRGEVFGAISPNYELSGPRSVNEPVVLIDYDYRSTLWASLPRFSEESPLGSIFYINKSTGALFLDQGCSFDSETEALGAKVVKVLADVKLANYFATSQCDIEQDIYRLDFDGISKLGEAIRTGQGTKLKSQDAKKLFGRYKLANYTWGSGDDSEAERRLGDYALYRYGGKAVLPKHISDPSKTEIYHQTFLGLLENLSRLEIEACPEDLKILRSLKKFYFDSDIYRVAGEALLKGGQATKVQAAVG